MKHILNIEHHNMNYILIALRSDCLCYQLAYFLNKLSSFDFKRVDEDLHYSVNNKKVFFPTFVDWNSELKRKSFLIKNKYIYKLKLDSTGLFKHNHISKTILLIPELKQFDYLLKLSGVWKGTELHILKENLNNLTQIASQNTIELNNLKSISNLVF